MHSTSLARLMALGLLGTSLGIAKDSSNTTTPTAEGPAVQMDKLVVNAKVNLTPLEQGWKKYALPGLTVYSHNTILATRVIDEMPAVRAAFQVVWNDARLTGIPVTVVIANGDKEFKSWTLLGDSATDQSCTYSPLYGRLVFVLNADIEGVHLALKRAYVKALLAQQRPRMPWWLEEGLADTLKDATLDGNTCSFGRIRAQNEIVPSNLLQMILSDVNQILPGHYLAVLQDPKKAPSEDRIIHTTSSSRDRIVVEVTDPSNYSTEFDCSVVPLYPINGDWATAAQVTEYCMKELDARKTGEKKVVDASTTFNEYFIDRSLDNLTAVFSDKEGDTIERRMKAWAFVHTTLYAEKQKFAPGLVTFARLQATGTKLEDCFQQAFNVNERLYTEIVNEHIRGDKYAIPVYKLDPAGLPSAAQKTAVPAEELEMVLLHGEFLTKENHQPEARTYLRDAYRRSHLQTAELFAALGVVEDDKDSAFALLKAAKSQGPITPTAELRLSRLRLESLVGNQHQLNLGETGALLDPLLKLYKDGYRIEELFSVMADIWLASEVKPSEANLTIVLQGIRQYPADANLRARVATLLEKLGLKEEAQILRTPRKTN